jgi:hypothetical protein
LEHYLIAQNSTLLVYWHRRITIDWVFRICFQYPLGNEKKFFHINNFYSDVLYSPARILGAIVNQTYDVYSGKLYVGLFTSVQYPYFFTSIALASKPGTVSSTSRLTSTCSFKVNEPCYQQWEIVLTLSKGNCFFDGYYQYNFGVSCNDTCPINKADNETISFYLTSGDVCATLRDTVSLANQLSTYK